MAAASACCYHLYSLVLKYFKYEYYDTLIYSKDAKLIFPHVTICDTSGLSEFTVSTGNHEAMLNVSKSWQKMKQYVQNKTDPILEEYLYMLNTYQSIQANMREKDQLELGLTTDDFILHCTYLDSECNAENFRLYMHPSYWNCYTFKGLSGHNVSHIGYNNVGPQNGLSLIFIVHNPIKSYFYEHLSVVYMTIT